MTINSITCILTTNVFINPLPVAPVIAIQTFCSASNPTIASLPQNGGTYKWYSADNDGSFLNAGIAVTTGTYYVNETTNSCQGPRAAVSVIVNQTPAAPTVAAQAFCSSLNPTIALLPQNGGAYKWYYGNVTTLVLSEQVPL